MSTVELAKSILKMTEEVAQELSTCGQIRLDHKDVRELLCAAAQIEAQRKILNELLMLNHHKRMQLNPMSLMNPLAGSSMEKED